MSVMKITQAYMYAIHNDTCPMYTSPSETSMCTLSGMAMLS